MVGLQKKPTVLAIRSKIWFLKGNKIAVKSCEREGYVSICIALQNNLVNT